MKTFKECLTIKEIDQYIIPCVLSTKMLCKCVPECLAREILEFALELNRLRNKGYCPTSSQGIQSTQAGPGIFNYCPLIPKWKTIHQHETGKKLVLSPRQAYELYDFLNTKRSKFGPILREIIRQEQEKRFAQQKVYHPSCGQGITISQPGTREFCIKTEHRFKRKVKSNCHNNCCRVAKKKCCSKGKCKFTTCY